MPDAPSTREQKKRRISKACDFCNRRGIRCRQSSNADKCENCIAFDQPCTFERPTKRRGARPKTKNSNESQAANPGTASFEPSTGSKRPQHGTTAHTFEGQMVGAAVGLHGLTSSRGESCNGPTQDWRAPAATDHAMVVDLVELFFEIVYPIFPLFHQPSFMRRVSRGEYSRDRPLYTITMAVCALVSSRIRDGAIFSPQWDLASFRHLQPDLYYSEAVREVSVDASASDLNYLRTHAVLALAAIQDGRIQGAMHQHLGQYHTLVAMNGLHDEDNWPSGIGIIETEERRRLFWTIYTLDVFTSIVWGGVIRSRECQSNVRYPVEADDDTFDDTGFASGEPHSNTNASESLASSQVADVCWIAGRNFVADLYRIMEHVYTRSRPRKDTSRVQQLLHEVVQDWTSLSPEWTQSRLMQLYSGLPQCFRETKPVTYKPKLDRFGFQAADIIATVQLLRMVFLSATRASISERCQIANEVINAFTTIPVAYQRAISVPLLFHLGVIGQILGSALEQPLAQTDYSSIRDVLFAMVQLLSSLEGVHAGKGASQRLQDQISKIDMYMSSQRSTYKPQPLNARSVTEGNDGLGDSTRTDSRYSAHGSASFDETLSVSPFQLPSELLGEFAQAFDFTQMSQNWFGD